MSTIGVKPANREPGHVRRGVIGVLRRADSLLMVRRAAGVAKGGFWCFPGGHVEAGETPRMAVVRELWEELGIRVDPLRRLGAVRVHDSRHVLAVWQVTCAGCAVQPAAAEIADWRWVPIAELRSLNPGLESNGAVFEMLRL